MNTKKRKDVEEDFYLPSIPKSRRLDPEFYAITEEQHNKPNHHEDHSLTEERALVLYHPPNNTDNTPFLKSPAPSDFSIIVNSDLIPGLKDYLLSWGITKPDNSVEDEMRKEKSSEGSNGCLAVVPWVAFHSPMSSEEIAQETCQPSEAKQDEMMELDEPYANNNNEKAMEIGDMMVEAAGASSPWQQQQQQQHCMMFNHLQNTATPIHWWYNA